MFSKDFLIASGERAIATYIQTFLGLIIVSAFNGGVIDVSAIQAAAVAAIPALLSIVKSAVGSQIGDSNSPAWLPAPAAPEAPAPGE